MFTEVSHGPTSLEQHSLPPTDRVYFTQNAATYIEVKLDHGDVLIRSSFGRLVLLPAAANEVRLRVEGL